MTNKLQLFVVLVFLLNSSSATFYDTFRAHYRMYEDKKPYKEDPVLETPTIDKEYDFVVIGSGPGGASVANRLSEVSDWNVLVLEAGKDGSFMTDIPALVSYLQQTDYNWGYRLEREEGICLAMKDQRCPWPRGKGMGGTSLINYMIYTRGHPKDYDLYEEAGNEGWGYKDVLPYFMKSEKVNIPEYMNSTRHSKSGFLDVEWIPYKTELVDVFMDACKEMGYSKIDYNSGKAHEGSSRIQVTMRSGRRVSAAKAYLEPVKQRSNLHIAEKAVVTKILIDQRTKRAIGVEYLKDETKKVVYVKREVILSAGTLNSPQLLMLSGVGPREHLESHKIPVIKDLPVGENLQEHFTMPGMVFLVNSTQSIVENRDLDFGNILKWFGQGKGILTLPGGVEGINYFSSKYNQEKDLPDLEMLFIAGSIASDGGNSVKDSFGISDEFYNSVYDSISFRDTMTVFPILLRPKSRGTVRLQDNNPLHWPLMYLNYFNDSRDLDVMVDGLKKVYHLGQTDAFKRVDAKFHSVTFPQCSHIQFASDDYWACAARTLILTLHHQSGTCKMGPSSDPTAVVDPRLRVHGITGLRVVDASIFPNVPTAHLYAPTIVVGEKAADMIKEDWGKPVVYKKVEM